MGSKMTEFLSALCLIFVIEGSLYALFPEGMKRAMAMVLDQSAAQLRAAGLVAAVLGIAFLWLIRG
jgi:uncharacterized protein YjeT (DUF2065 family)